MMPVLIYVHILHLFFHPPVGLVIITGYVHVIDHDMGTWVPVVLTKPRDEQRNFSGITNQWGRNRYFSNQIGSWADCVCCQLHLDIPPDKPTPNPSTSPSARTFVSKFLYQFSMPKFRLLKFYIKLYIRAHAKYWSRKRQRRHQWKDCPSDLNGWHHVENWIPTDLVDDIIFLSCNKYYIIHYLFHRDAFVLGLMLTVASPLADIFQWTKSTHQK